MAHNPRRCRRRPHQGSEEMGSHVGRFRGRGDRAKHSLSGRCPYQTHHHVQSRRILRRPREGQDRERECRDGARTRDDCHHACAQPARTGGRRGAIGAVHPMRTTHPRVSMEPTRVATPDPCEQGDEFQRRQGFGGRSPPRDTATPSDCNMEQTLPAQVVTNQAAAIYDLPRVQFLQGRTHDGTNSERGGSRVYYRRRRRRKWHIWVHFRDTYIT
mmetsp:Transcript_7031/g.12625  ORF Transcript_7031/g.12625 Transcript_7031/m.12625 type:complete len:215 (+) Transcript_7031:2910-3554(+)